MENFLGKEFISFDCVFIVYSRWLKKYFEFIVWNIFNNLYFLCNNNKFYYFEFNVVLYL